MEPYDSIANKCMFPNKQNHREFSFVQQKEISKKRKELKV